MAPPYTDWLPSAASAEDPELYQQMYAGWFVREHRGAYRSELKANGIVNKPLTIRMVLTIRDNEIEIDSASAAPRSTV